MSESTEQQDVIYWFRTQYRDKIIFAIPNGAWLSGDAKRRAILMRKMKKEGLLSGVSDLFIAVPKNNPHSACGLFIEMKDVGKTQSSLSNEQVNFIVKMREQGYRAEMAAGFDEARAIIEDYMR